MNLNAWNSQTMKVLKDCGLARVTAPLELTSAEIKQAGHAGLEREMIVYGRAALMTMRHCPVNAHAKLCHADCHLCDAGRGLEECSLIDRKRVSFPLRRYRGESGCYAQILNSAPHDVRGRRNPTARLRRGEDNIYRRRRGHAPGRCKGRAGSN